MKKTVIYSGLEEKINQVVSSRRKSLLIIFLLAVLAYSNIFPNAYAQEDYDYITSWSLIQDLGNLPRFFVGFIPPEGEVGVYSPLKTLIHSLVYNVSIGHPLGFHILSMLVQLSGVYIIFQLTLLLTANTFVSFLTGVLFALHPVHVEAITSMSSAADTLGIIFLFFSFYYYIKGIGYEGSLTISESADGSVAPTNLSGRPADYRRSLVLAVLAVFTNELAVSLPFLFFFYDYFFSRAEKSLRLSLQRVFPYFLIAGIYFISKWLVLGQVVSGHYLYDSFYLTMMVIIKAWAKYLGLLLFPGTLTYNHIISSGIFSYDPSDFDSFAVLSQSPLEPQALFSLIVLTGLIVAGYKARTKKPWFSFCVGWFFITLLPVSSIIPGSVYFAERYLYAGSWVFCLSLSYGFYWLYTHQKFGTVFIKRSVVALCVAGLMTFYMGRTFLRNQDWKDQLTISEAAVKANPQSASLRNDLGIVYLRYGELLKSKENFEKAISLKPEEAHFYFSAEETYSGLEDYDKAITYLKKAVALNPQFAEAYFNLAGIHAYLNKRHESSDYLQKAVDLYRQQNRILEAGKAMISIETYLRLPPEEDTAAEPDAAQNQPSQ